MSLLRLHSEPLKNEWLDTYGHLNEAYYLVPFTNATWALQDHFRIGVDYFEKTGGAIYTVETHLRYLQEIRAPAVMDVESLILGCDAKRVWFAHRLLVDEVPCATGEFMALHYDSRAKRTCPMPETVQAALVTAVADARPDWVSRRISLDKP